MAHLDIDPAWWAPAFADTGEEGADRWEPIEIVSRKIQQLAEAAPEGTEQRDVLRALAIVSSAMLQPEDWNEPFKPFIVLGGRRSALPEDLSPEELTLVAACLPQIAQPCLRARVADVLWLNETSNSSLLGAAVDAYMAVPLVPEAWIRRGADSWRRAVELVRRRGAAERGRHQHISGTLRTSILAMTAADGFTLIGLADLLREAGGTDQIERRLIADHLTLAAAEADQSGNFRLARHLERAAVPWLRSLTDSVAVDEAHHRIALLYEREADERAAAENASAMAEGIFVEKAISTLMTLPRKYRVANGLDLHLGSLRGRLADVREATLESMHSFKSDPIDLTDAVADTRSRLSGLDRFDALVEFAKIWPLADPERERATAEELLEGSLAHLFGGATYSSDGRKVAVSDGGLSDPAARIEADMTRNWGMKLGIVATAFLVPGLEVISYEHRYEPGFLLRLCVESPWVPEGHEGLWARGLQHGLAGDFPSAVSMLIPQVEQALRRALKGNGVHTLFVEPSTGVESEKSLPALLALPEATEVLGPHLQFELSTLLVRQAGVNLRHDVAHGLFDDAESWSAGAIYGWWLCLLLVVIPLANARSVAGAGGGEESDLAMQTETDESASGS